MDWWWIVTLNESMSRRKLIGPYRSEQSAEDSAVRLSTPYDIISLKTKNIAKASSLIKGREFEKTGAMIERVSRQEISSV